MQVKVVKGNNAPLEMMTPGLEIKQFTIPVGEHSIELDDEHIHSFYLIEGSIDITKGKINNDDFFTVSDGGKFSLTASQNSQLFLISALKEIDYIAYASTR
jgi:redox-sensitive bicupin YhaK (pirin superfamily)